MTAPRKRFHQAGLALAAGIGLSALAGHPAHAGLLGDTVNIQYHYPDTAGSIFNFTYGVETVTGSGVVFTAVANEFNVTVTDTSVQIAFLPGDTPSQWTNSAFNGFVLTDDSNPLPSFSIDPTTDMAGFSTADLTESGNVLYVNFAGLSYGPNTVVTLDAAGASNVPEPMTLALFGMGLAGLGWARRADRSPATYGRLAQP